jgi:HK97 gp10 family phage protein
MFRLLWNRRNNVANRTWFLTWRGAEVGNAVRRATIAGMKETLEAAVKQAKENAPVRSGALRDDIQYHGPFEGDKRITGTWGNFNIPYALFVEFGTVNMAAQYYLTRAKDQEHPKLNERIKAHFERESR